ncbi:unnamed protein product [Linum trigynum]|uniref:Uncharacterized protein n=1 Tax=Linum trigynum TaxID=586398 RepID=A0AAV2FL20_9ROSI
MRKTTKLLFWFWGREREEQNKVNAGRRKRRASNAKQRGEHATSTLFPRRERQRVHYRLDRTKIRPSLTRAMRPKRRR